MFGLLLFYRVIYYGTRIAELFYYTKDDFDVLTNSRQLNDVICTSLMTRVIFCVWIVSDQIKYVESFRIFNGAHFFIYAMCNRLKKIFPTY